MTPNPVVAVALNSIPIIKPGDALVSIILEAVEESGFNLTEGDIFVISSKIVSKSEGRIVKASEITPSKEAMDIAERNGFNPTHVELALRQSAEVITSDGVLITETNSGLICNFSGVDRSNAPGEEYILLPENPDQSAERIRQDLRKETDLNLGVILADSQGRPWRKGLVNVAIGCAGINAFKYNRGKSDLHGRILKSSTVCQIDELAALAEPLMGQAGEGVPVVIIRGYEFVDGSENAGDVNRPKEEDLFRKQTKKRGEWAQS